MFLSLFRRLRRKSRLPQPRARPRAYLWLEMLETRLTPATHIWSGQGGDNLASNRFN